MDMRGEAGPGHAGELSIDLHQPLHLVYWCRELGLSYEQLRHVVEATGTSVEKVRDFLRASSPPARPA